MPDYFRTMGIRLVRGRDFTAADAGESVPVAIINEAMARRCWPGEDPIGRTIRLGSAPEERQRALTVVGVAANARQDDWTAPAADEIYLPYAQRPDSFGLSYLTFVVKTRVQPERLSSAAREAIGSFSQTLPVSEVIAMDRVVADALWRPRLASLLMRGFAGAALLLAAVGVYGVIAQSVRRRTQEIGIRMALGASPAYVVRQAFLEGMKPVWFGAATGLICALLLTRYMQTLLYEVKPWDPVTFGTVSMLLLAIAAAATLIPALRAARVDPLTALKYD